MLKKLIFLLAFLSILSACDESISFPLAAITNSNSGGVVNVTVKSFESETPHIFVSLPPYYGIDLQRSIVDAIKYGNSGNCSFVVYFDSSSEYMEGPSAGAAFTIAAYLLSNNLSQYKMPVITGAIGPGGIVLPVGGLYEKATASARAGVDLFVFPKGDLYDYIMVKKVEEKTKMKTVAVKTINETIELILYNKTPAVTEFLYVSYTENISNYEGKKSADFLPIAKKMIEREKETIEELNESAEVWIVDYFSALTRDCDEIASKGYYYTAANKAFLAYVDTRSLIFVYTGKPSYEEEKERVRSCLASLQRPKLTEDNLEWVAAFDLRKAWAEDNLHKANMSSSHLLDQELAAYKDLVFAEAWCLAAVDFEKKANEKAKGNELDENLLEKIAMDYYIAANKTIHSADTQERFEIATRLYNDKKYLAAIFDFIYVLSMDEARANSSILGEFEISKSVNEMAKVDARYTWPSIYRSQAVFMISSPQSDYSGAYSLFLFSQNLDHALEKIHNVCINQKTDKDEKGIGLSLPYLSTDTIFGVVIVGMFILLAFLLLYILPKTKGRSYERENLPAHRASRRARKRNIEG
ncbi:MAG: S16 family serine protease [Candidatus Bilamarchaeaceae archaeon]